MTLVILRALRCLAIALKIAVGCCAALCRFSLQPFPHGDAPALLCPFGKDQAWEPVSQEKHRSGRVEPFMGELRTLQPPPTANVNVDLARLTLPRASQQNCIGEAGISHLCDAQETSQRAGAEGRALCSCLAPSLCTSLAPCRCSGDEKANRPCL